jgi:catalase
MPSSPALQIIGKMKETLEGRSVGILVDEGSDANTVKALRKAAQDAGATVKLVAPKLGLTLSDGKRVAADGQLAGTPSVVFDAVALVLSEDAGKRLAKIAAAVDFGRDAFGHLKAIAADAGGQSVLKAGNVGKDAGVVEATDIKSFIKAAKTRQWDREPKVRQLA